jgi:spermidine synthase
MSRISRPAIYLLYFFSGGAALGAEVVWSRVLCRLLGSEAWAVALVLSAFLGGMGLGALCVQAWLARMRNPLAVFAAVEFTAAACTLGFTFLLNAGAGLIRGGGGELVAAVLMVVATLPLGAGFPILVAAVGGHPGSGEANRCVRRLYGLNALGGALGGAAAGLLGVALLGERTVLIGAAGLQALVATGAALLSRRAGLPSPRAAEISGERRPGGVGRELGAGAGTLLVPYLFLSGFAVFFWEVVWTRVLVLTVGSSVYAFSVVAASVVLGIGAGSLVFGGRLLARQGAWLLPLATALLTFAAYFAVPRLPDAYLLAVRSLELSPLLCGALGAGMVVVLPNFLLGSLFPWVVSRRPHLAGSLYAVNCLGCVAGALCGGPLTAGRLSLEHTFRVGLAVLLALAACGAWLLRAESRSPWTPPRRVAVAGLSLLSLLAFAGSFRTFLPSGLRDLRVWGYKQLLSGVYQWSREDLEDGGRRLESTYAWRELLKVVEGREVIVSVELDREANTVYVLGNGKVEGSVPFDRARTSKADLPTQLLLGMAPPLVAPGGEDSSFLLIGLGSGVTLGAILDTRERLGAGGAIDVVELEPAYLEAISDGAVVPFLEPYLDARGLESLAGVRWHFGDARRVLAQELCARRYTAIISQPSEPWIAGAAPLFTVEFFREARDLLAGDGVFAQWVQLYRLDPGSLRLLVRTFRAVFPRVYVLRPPRTGELILLGTGGKLDLSRLLRSPQPSHLEAAHISGPLGWLAVYLLGPGGVSRWVGLDPGLPLNTDGRGELEFRAPRALYQGSDAARHNLGTIRSFAAADPVSRYLPERLRRPAVKRQLARANVLLGDLEEAEALLAGDGSAAADSIRAEIAEARR